MPSLIVSLLSERPTEELEALRDDLRRERARVDVESRQVDEALALQARRTSKPIRSTAARPGGTRKRVLDVFVKAGHPMSPAEVIEALDAGGGSPSRGAVHNMIGRLVESGDLWRIAEGRYDLASRSGDAARASAGQSELSVSPNGTAVETDQAEETAGFQNR